MLPIFVHKRGSIERLRACREQFGAALGEWIGTCERVSKMGLNVRLRRAAESDPFMLFDAYQSRDQSHAEIMCVVEKLEEMGIVVLIMDDDLRMSAPASYVAGVLHALRSSRWQLVDLCPGRVRQASSVASRRVARVEELEGVEAWSVPIERPREIGGAVLVRQGGLSEARMVWPPVFGRPDASTEALAKFCIYRDVVCRRMVRPCEIIDVCSGKMVRSPRILTFEDVVRCDFRDHGLVYLCRSSMVEEEREKRALQCMYAAARMRIPSVCVARRRVEAGATESRVVVVEAGGREPEDEEVRISGFMTHSSAMLQTVRVMVVPMIDS
jgi:hypothetical protein